MKHHKLTRFVQTLANFTKWALILSFSLSLGMASSLNVERGNPFSSFAVTIQEWWNFKYPSVSSLNSPLVKNELDISDRNLSEVHVLQMMLAQAQSKLEWLENRLKEEEEVGGGISHEAYTKQKQLEEALARIRLLEQKTTKLIKENTCLSQRLDHLAQENKQLCQQLEDASDPIFTMPEQIINELSRQALELQSKFTTAPAYLENLNLLLQNYRAPLVEGQKAALLSFWGIENSGIRSIKELINHDQ